MTDIQTTTPPNQQSSTEGKGDFRCTIVDGRPLLELVERNDDDTIASIKQISYGRHGDLQYLHQIRNNSVELLKTLGVKLDPVSYQELPSTKKAEAALAV